MQFESSVPAAQESLDDLEDLLDDALLELDHGLAATGVSRMTSSDGNKIKSDIQQTTSTSSSATNNECDDASILRDLAQGMEDLLKKTIKSDDKEKCKDKEDDNGNGEEDEDSNLLNEEWKKAMNDWTKAMEDFIAKESNGKNVDDLGGSKDVGVSGGKSSDALNTNDSSTKTAVPLAEDDFEANIQGLVNQLQANEQNIQDRMKQKSGTDSKSKNEDDFAMDLLQSLLAANGSASGSNGSGGGVGGESEMGADFMKKLLNELESNDANNANNNNSSGNEEGMMQGLLDTFMLQFVSKDVLYEPMKDLSIKYPIWLEKNKDTLEKSEFDNIQKQYECVIKIVACFERIGKDGNNDETLIKREIMEHLQQMQEHGTPPEAMIQELVPGYEPGQLDSLFPSLVSK